jgi:hypothetical protein
MSDLSRDARDLLARARRAKDGLPDDVALARSRGTLVRRVSVGAAAGTAIAAATKVAPAASAAGGSFLVAVAKGVAIAAVVVGGATAAEYMTETRAPVAAPRVVVVPSAIVTTAPPPAPVAPVVVAPPAPSATPAPPVPKTPIALPTAPPAPAVTSVPEPAATVALPVPRAAPRDLGPDVAHLRAAEAALAAGDVDRAREEAERVSPDGPLAEERDGVRVLAACARGQSAEADLFAKKYPRSSLLPRIRSDCR